jgi:NADH-quinone oxidoreductase subunit G
MQDGEIYLAGTARPVVARMSEATAARAGVADGDKVTIAFGNTATGSATLPVEVTSMADDVVWAPAGSCPGTGHGSMVTVRRPNEETL